MDKEVKYLIEQHISEIDKDNYTNIIAAAAEKGFDCLVELRRVLNEADIKGFDKQLIKMLTNYKEITELAEKMIIFTR